MSITSYCHGDYFKTDEVRNVKLLTEDYYNNLIDDNSNLRMEIAKLIGEKLSLSAKHELDIRNQLIHIDSLKEQNTILREQLSELENEKKFPTPEDVYKLLIERLPELENEHKLLKSEIGELKANLVKIESLQSQHYE
jgi:hypothetical protein